MKIELSGDDELELEHLLEGIDIGHHRIGYVKPSDQDYTPLICLTAPHEIIDELGHTTPVGIIG